MTTPRNRRSDFTAADATVNTFAQAITESLARLQRMHGGKEIAAWFDGRDGAEVATSTVSRWISEPRRFPALFLPVLVERDALFRAYVFEHLVARISAPSNIVEHLSASAADEYRRVVAEQLALWPDVQPARRRAR